MKGKLIPFDKDVRFSSTHGDIHRYFGERISSGVQTLLEKKHLYQSVTIDDSELFAHLRDADVEESMTFFSGAEMFQNTTRDLSVLVLGKTAADQKIAEEKRIRAQKQGFREAFVKFAERIGHGPWILESETGPWNAPLRKTIINPPIEQWATYRLPTVRTACANCDAVAPPHNSGYPTLNHDVPSHDLSPGKETVQVFSLPYQCQNCRCEPVIFLVRREGRKLSLVGRSQLEQVSTPNFVPKEVARFYRSAIVARNCNQVLGGIFLLRTLVEQHMRKSSGNDSIKLTGDELADRYSATLPSNFSGSFPSLKKIYSDLSVAMHSANEDGNVFDLQLRAIESHLDGLRVFRDRSKS